MLRKLIHLPHYALLLLCLLATGLQAAQIVQSPNDPRHYHAFTLDNGIRALVISDPDTDKATASLEVGVGSGDDPDAYAGLAHFLEHMLFLGTDKYPEAGAYQAYISERGGMHNAFTAHDRTNYFFDIDQAHLEPALDRFAQFFIAPRFTPEYVDRERHAVHSEYQSKLKEDSLRGYAAFRQTLNPDHPLANFSVGSLDTLQDRPDKPLRQVLIDFYRAHYSSRNMTLVVLGREPVETLEAMVRAKFAAVADRPVAQRPAPVALFPEGRLPAQLNVASLREMHQLSLTFPTPPVREHFRTKPLHYLSALLGHEGQGSLLALLKARGLATGLSAGPGINYADYASLSVNIDLTDAGYARYTEVVDLVFQTLRLIREQGIQPRLFEEERLINQTNFRFQERGRQVYYALNLAANLREYPLEEVLHGDYLYERYDAGLIRRYLDRLTPDNLLLTLTAKEVETDRVEPHYQTPYRLAKIDESLLAHWRRGEIDTALAIPPANPFLATDFNLKQGQASDHPQRLRQLPGLTLWFQQDSTFNTPKADLFFTLRSPVANDSPRHHLLTKLYIDLANAQLNSFVYPAQLAGLHLRLYDHLRGFSVRISGYNDKQALLLERIARTLQQVRIEPDKLAIYKERLRRRLENSRRDKPYNQAMQEIYLEVLSPQWSVDARLAELDSIDADELARFATELLGQGELVILAHGNLDRDDALGLSTILENTLLKGLDPVAVAPGRVRLLPAQQAVKRLDIDHNDSAISLYLQGPDKAPATRARYALLAEVLSAPFYTQLRTEQQLGYVVFASPMPILDHPALALVIQSPSASGPELEHHIDRFLAESRTLVSALDEAALEKFKQSLLVQLLKKDQQLSERSDRYWREIDRENDAFDSREQVAAAIRATTRADLLTTYEQLNQRRLAVYSTGRSVAPAVARTRDGADS